MKKITFLLFFTISLGYSQLPDVRNFVVTANSNVSYDWYDRFDFKFDIKGNYGYGEIKLWLYTGLKTSKPSTNTDLVSYSRWNREGDDNLNFPNYFTKSWWNSWTRGGSSAPPYAIAGKTFTLLVQFNNVSRFLYYTVPTLGNPDLTVDLVNSQAFSSCQSCFPWFNLFLNSNKRHLIAGGVGSISFDNLEVRNTGNTSSNSSNVEFWFSVDNTLNTNADQFIKSVSMPARNVNSSYGIDTRINGWDLFSCTNCGSNNGNYHIMIRLDAGNTNNEGTAGEANNILAIPITYTTNVTATSLKTKLPFSTNTSEDTKPYIIDIFNLQGQKILSKKVRNINQENDAALNLSAGIYIIKSEKGDRKISVNNN